MICPMLPGMSSFNEASEASACRVALQRLRKQMAIARKQVEHGGTDQMLAASA